MKVKNARLKRFNKTNKKVNRGLWFPVTIICIAIVYIVVKCLFNWPNNEIDSKTETGESHLDDEVVIIKN